MSREHPEKVFGYRSLRSGVGLMALALIVAGCFEDRMLGMFAMNRDGGQGGAGGGPPLASGPCASASDHSSCQALSGCRWLEPGCGGPALPRATCAPLADLNCRMDADCPTGKRCLTYSIHPCAGPAVPGQATCAACGQQVQVCW